MLDDETKPTKLTATAEVDAKKLVGWTSEDPKTFVMEFYQISVDKEDGTVTPGGLLFGRYAAFSVNQPVLLTANDIDVTPPAGWPQAGTSVYVNAPPETDTLKWSASVEPGDYTWSQFEWYSDAPKVADIDKYSGQVTLYGKGTAISM